MTAVERKRLDKRYKRMSNACRWIKKHISHRLGFKLQLMVWDRWDDSLNR